MGILSTLLDFIFRRRHPPKPTPSPPPAPPGAGIDLGRLFLLHNQSRINAGLPSLAYDARLAAIAQVQANLNAVRGVLEDPQMEPILQLGFHTAEGNATAGQRTPEEAMGSWLSSPGHKRNILSPRVTSVGLGVATSGSGTMYWVGAFGG